MKRRKKGDFFGIFTEPEPRLGFSKGGSFLNDNRGSILNDI